MPGSIKPAPISFSAIAGGTCTAPAFVDARLNHMMSSKSSCECADFTRALCPTHPTPSYAVAGFRAVAAATTLRPMIHAGMRPRVNSTTVIRKLSRKPIV